MNDFLGQGFKSLPVWIQALITLALIVVLWIALRPQPIEKVEETE